MASARELLRSGFAVGVTLSMFLSFIVILVVLDAVLPSADGESFLRQNIGIIPAMGFMSLAFVGTSVTLVAYRDRGTLRLLGTTPLSRRSILLGQLPVRAVIAALESLIVLVLMWSTGTRSPVTLACAAVTLAFGAAMFLSLGLLLGARGTNVDLTMQISLIAPVVLIATSGVALPAEVLPVWLAAVFDALPTTWFVGAFGQGAAMSLAGILTAWAGLVAAALVAFAIAIRIFDWGDEKRG